MRLQDSATGPAAAVAWEPAVTTSIDSEDELVATIVEAFADEAVDVDPADREPLYEWIDPDGLAAVLTSSRRDCRVEAVIWGHRTVITPDGVEIDEPVGPLH